MKVLSITSVLLVCLISFVGCKQESASTTPLPKDHGNDHVDGEEYTDHSVLGHGHGAGPHDGVIVDWGGGKYHVEFIVDHEKQAGTVYIFGADEKTPNPIDATEIEMSITDPVMQLTLKAAPQDNDPAGKASRFIGTHEKLGVVQEYAGTITGVIDGTPYSGDFAEEAHGHE
ncbi:hypothetical protein [Planctomycetes bacterium TBK1r]|uniref:CHRD domain-containing protein n=1 Tax=Stieleria magnilauensis TaxID=2527963 RepID=A0ABX5XJH3_9BACT|nr:hypothetical protein TBK1r_10630 [Planctomycetes bacterium TBK1r]